MKPLIVLTLCLSLTACSKQATTVNPPTTGPSQLTIDLDIVASVIAGAAPNITSPVAAAWIATGPAAVTSVATCVQKNATPACLTSINAFVQAMPTTGIPAADAAALKSVAAAVSEFVSLYSQQVSEVATSALTANLRIGDPNEEMVISGHVVKLSQLTPVWLSQFQSAPSASQRHWTPTTADKHQLEATKKRAKETAKKLKERKTASLHCPGDGGPLGSPSLRAAMAKCS